MLKHTDDENLPLLIDELVEKINSSILELKKTLNNKKLTPLAQTKMLLRHIESALTYTSGLGWQDALSSIFPNRQFIDLTIDLLHAVGLGQGEFQDVNSNLAKTIIEIKKRSNSPLLSKVRPLKRYISLIEKAHKKIVQKRVVSGLASIPREKLLAISIEA